MLGVFPFVIKRQLQSPLGCMAKLLSSYWGSVSIEVVISAAVAPILSF